MQDPKPAGLRIAVVGGGCSGFSYSMAFKNRPEHADQTYNYEGLKVFVDQASLLYLEGAEVDYVETLEGYRAQVQQPQRQVDVRLRQFFQRVTADKLGLERDYRSRPQAGIPLRPRLFLVSPTAASATCRTRRWCGPMRRRRLPGRKTRSHRCEKHGRHLPSPSRNRPSSDA